MAKPQKERASEKRWRVQAGGEETEAAYDPPLIQPLRGICALAHGAGGSMDTRNLLREAKILRELGLAVVRFNFFYRAAGRKYPDKMPQLMACYSAVVNSIPANAGADPRVPPAPLAKGAPVGEAGVQAGMPLRFFIGGHSMGGRTATMMAAEGFACDGLILFSYPLHPPGKFDQLRAEHLPRIKAPVLCFNGTRDDFMRRDLMERVLDGLKAAATPWTHHWLEHADHGLNVLQKSGRTNADVDSGIKEALMAWLYPHGKEPSA